MNGPTDQELLREYAARHAEPAFGELVRRHVDLVYSAALRMVRDPQLAEEVTQSVFVALSRSAGQLAEHPVLSGWLHRTTQNLAANAVRYDVRRRAREQEAAIMNNLFSKEPSPSDTNWDEIAPHLDTALGELNESDRDALLLRYFERKSAREIGQTLGTSEAAAQKRVNRAVERLRELLAKRGVTAGTAGLVALIPAHAIQAAPAGLALSITTSALAGTAVASAMTTSNAVTTIAMTTIQKTLVVSGLAIAIGVGTYQARQASMLRARLQSIQQNQSLPPRTQDGALTSLQAKVDALQGENSRLSAALSAAGFEKSRLETERDQTRRSIDLYKQLVEQSAANEPNPTNAYPSPRHVWAAFGRLGRLMALSKAEDGKLSQDEKSALEAAKTKALGQLPGLLQAVKSLDSGKPPGSEMDWAEVTDGTACLLYGALNLDEQQFNQIYDVMQRLQLEAKQNGLLAETKGPQSVDAVQRIMEKFKSDVHPLLTPEQVPIFEDVVTHVQVEPGKVGFNFSF